MADNGTASEHTLHTLAWQSITQALTGLGFNTGATLAPRLATALGWPVRLTAADYARRYQRDPLAQRIVDIYADYTWRLAPRITDDAQADPVTPFEAAYQTLAEAHHLPMVWQQLDRLLGLGHYAVLLLGVDDGLPLAQPLRRARALTYVRPYSEEWATIEAWNTDETSPRYLKPDLYRLDIGRGNADLVATRTARDARPTLVHWSRLVHVTENSFDGGITGTPRLRSLWNALEDLVLLYGSSTLMFYRGGIGRYVAALRDGAQPPTGQEKEVLQQHFDEFIADLRQMLRVQGMDVRLLEASIASPKDQIEAHLALIASGAGIPQRILYGSERGELASSQDQTDWETTITSRQHNIMAPLFVHATLDRLIASGILPPPQGGEYDVLWPPSRSTNPIRQAEIAERMGRALAAYIAGQGELVVPVGEFRERYLGLEAIPEGGFPEEELDREEPEEEPPSADDEGEEEDAA
jgi:hypothetical protein